MMLGRTSDPFVCDSVLDSDLFNICAMLTALGSFFATGGCEKHTNNKVNHGQWKPMETKQFLHGRNTER